MESSLFDTAKSEGEQRMREGWEYKRLGELCDIVMGQSPMGNSINENNGIEFHQGKTNFGDKFLMESGIYTTSPIRIAEKKTILLCVRAPVGIINITERQVCIGRGLSSLKPRLGLELLYLYYCLLSKQNYFESNSTGSTFKAISSKVINNTIIQSPPKPTQLSIVSELDKLNELIQIKKEQLKDYDALAQSIFYEMFGDPVENEKGWEVKKFGDCFSIGAGGTPSTKVKEYWDNGTIPWIGSNMCQNCIITETDGKFITEEGLNHSSTKLLSPGTVLVALVGATIGKVGLLRIETCTNQNVAFIKVQEAETFTSEFVYYHLMGLYGEFMKIGQGNFKMANQGFIKLLPISCPPLSLQQSFAHKIEQIERQKAEVQKTITDLETLLAARMQYWFD